MMGVVISRVFICDMRLVEILWKVLLYMISLKKAIIRSKCIKCFVVSDNVGASKNISQYFHKSFCTID